MHLVVFICQSHSANDFVLCFAVQEDAALLRLVEFNGPNNWAEVSVQLPGRNAKSCRLRYAQGCDRSGKGLCLLVPPAYHQVIRCLLHQLQRTVVPSAPACAGGSTNCVTT